jgi:uncharacterized protein YprB with RNaseH-like and TPR domain
MFLDIESSSTRADSGQITAIGIIKDDKKEVKFVDSPENEREVLEWLKEKLKGCDLIINWYGSGFDLPYIISRAIKNNIDLHELLKIPSLDLCRFCQERLKLTKNSLVEVARFLKIEKDDELSGKEVQRLYMDAIRGNGKAKEAITNHCLSDLDTLQKIFERLKPYLNLNTTNK